MDSQRQSLDEWGLPIVSLGPVARDDEVGLTCDEDGDWMPATTWQPAPVTRTTFLAVFLAAGVSSLKLFVLNHRLHIRREHRRQ